MDFMNPFSARRKVIKKPWHQSEQDKQYKKDNPHHVWLYRSDGSRFVGHFKNKQEAVRWTKKTRTPLGKTTTASQPKKKRRSGYNQFRMV